MKRIIAVEPGEWVILPCILETDDCYYRVDVYPDGRVEASDDERFDKTDFYGPDYKRFAAIYNSRNDYMMFLRRPVPLTPEGNVPVAGVRPACHHRGEVPVGGGLTPPLALAAGFGGINQARHAHHRRDPSGGRRPTHRA